MKNDRTVVLSFALAGLIFTTGSVSYGKDKQDPAKAAAAAAAARSAAAADAAKAQADIQAARQSERGGRKNLQQTRQLERQAAAERRQTVLDERAAASANASERRAITAQDAPPPADVAIRIQARINLLENERKHNQNPGFQIAATQEQKDLQHALKHWDGVCGTNLTIDGRKK